MRLEVTGIESKLLHIATSSLAKDGLPEPIQFVKEEEKEEEEQEEESFLSESSFSILFSSCILSVSNEFG
jgi:hypothetical protein